MGACGSHLLRWTAGLFLGLYAVTLPCLLWTIAQLVFAGETWQARVLGAMIASAGSLPVTLTWAFGATGSRRRRWGPSGVAALVVVCGLLSLAVAAPHGIPPQGAHTVSRFLRAQAYSRWSPANLVPEIDQVKLGIALAAWIDPRMDAARAERVCGLALPLYREMRRTPEYAELGSVMNYAYADLFGGAADVGHVFAYVPERTHAGRPPALVFLHGAAGNFASYLRAWQRFADRRGAVLVCPSFGFGRWDRDGGVEVVERARRFAVEELGADPERVWLAGLSNGGMGVTRAVRRAPEAYRGLVYLSGVIEGSEWIASQFVDRWGARPILVLHGVRDERVPFSTADAAVRTARARGVRAELRAYPDEDHFLFFSSLDAVLGEIETAWDEEEARVPVASGASRGH